MKYHYTIKEQICEITIGQALHREESKILSQECKQLFETENFETLFFDMKDCSSISSAGIGAIISVAKESKKRKAQFELINCQEKVIKLLKVTGVNEVIKISE